MQAGRRDKALPEPLEEAETIAVDAVELAAQAMQRAKELLSNAVGPTEVRRAAEP